MLLFRRCGWYMFSSFYILLLKYNAEAQREFSLKDIVPPNYSHLHVPEDNSGEVMSLYVRCAQINLRSIDVSDMSFSVSLEMWLYWIDERLRFPAVITQNFTLLDNDWMNKIWNPKVYFRNAVEGKLDNVITASSLFWLDRLNTLYNCNRVILKLICEMELKSYPHDEQECGIQICSSTYVTEELYLQWTAWSKPPSVYTLHQYKVKELRFSNFSAPLNGPYFISCLGAMVRRTGYFIINVYIPTVLIVCMSMLSFWIPADSVPARITLEVTSLLTIITKQYQAPMPDVSYIVALNVWFSGCIAFVFLSLLELGVVIVLNSSASVSDSFRQKNIPSVMLRSNGTWSMKNNWSPRNSTKKPGKLWSRRIDLFSRIFFPLGFGIFSIIYWYIYTIESN